MIDRALVAAMAVAVAPTIASAQMTASQGVIPGQRLSTEVVGGTSEVARERFTSAGAALAPPPHVGPTGKMCLTVSPRAKSQAINPSIYDHILVLDNKCARTIKIQACYYGTTRCTTMSVGGYRLEQHNLGIFPSKDFRYAYREYVN